MAESTIKKIQKAISDFDEERLDKVLEFVEDLRQNDLMNKRAEAAEESIKYGKVVSFEKFSQDFEAWKNKKASTR
jgi:hypothetical protein